MRWISILAGVFVVMLGLMAGAGFDRTEAQTAPTPRDVLDELLRTPTVSETLFDQTFLSQVPANQVQNILDGLRQQLGAYQGLEGAAPTFTARFEKGTLPVTIVLNGQGKIAGLHAGVPTSVDKSTAYAQAVAQLEQLPGKVSLLVTKDGKDQTAFHADDKLAVGSAFKLAVLRAAKDQIDSNKLSWDHVYNLKPLWKSLPSGDLRNWPSGSALTLQTLASLMISVSDNTAADGMIDIVGRDAVEKYGGVNKPFPTTREAFVLKSDANSDLRDKYLNGTAAEKLDAVKQADGRPLPNIGDIFTSDGRQIEWFFDNRQLCDNIAAVADLPLMSINPGVADASQWKSVAYKGGSDDGVINLTQQLTASNGSKWCVSMSWNGDDVKEDTFTTLAASFIANLVP